MESSPDQLRERIREFIASKGTDPTRLSRQIGRSKDYIRDFLEGRKESLSWKSLVALENLLEVDRGALTSVSLPDTVEDLLRVQKGPYASIRETSSIIQVFPTRETGNEVGVLMLRAFPIEIVDRPSFIPTNARSFGALVETEAMLPAYEPGDIAIVNSELGIRKNTDVLICQSLPEEDIGDDPWAKVIICRLENYDGDQLIVRQYYPDRTFSLVRSEWRSVNRVVAKLHKR